ncbi:hypothetical protein MP228_013075 [Amoeboaphelidium protococcarum]|nr:hypothetical protein MP228_013075 [Amoeboaphelidium protococcarum]
MKLIFALAFACASAVLASDCPSFESSCSNACSSATGQMNNATCGPFRGMCSCKPSKDASQSAPDSNKVQNFCGSMNSTCSSSVCGEARLVDSFSCDGFSFSSQCLCFSNTNLNGGAMLGKNETQCQSKISECNSKCESKGGVKSNSCVDPAKAVCECNDGSEDSDAPSSSAQDSQSGNGGASLQLGSAMIVAVSGLAFALL